MQTPSRQTWQEKAAAKTAETRSKIRPEWTLKESEIEDARRKRQLSGPFIESFLNDDELAITRSETVLLAAEIKAGGFTALEVTLAFCKTAAIAHQIVS